jgi:hypothetical protein
MNEAPDTGGETMSHSYQILDKKTGEPLTGYHDGGGIFEFNRVHEPHVIYTTMGDIIRIMDRIAGCTGRRLTVMELD